ncbi:hypothetical protein AKJ09_05528 [Labilithrix luteola]|uniref:Outer membrane lipoprotein BamD-like domain-containing protein n=1 Tax=Labilithrix luteola TaxID=1391654 RepID=A0A0K1Q0D1_9BACT|nr:hypothetical protein AKJ09_05528 [Labilithrix luteola]
MPRIVDSASEFDSLLRHAIRAEQAAPSNAERLRRIGESLERKAAAQGASTTTETALRAGIRLLSLKRVLFGIGAVSLASVTLFTTVSSTRSVANSSNEGEGASVRTVSRAPTAPRSLQFTGELASARAPAEDMPAMSANDLPSAPPAPAKSGPVRAALAPRPAAESSPRPSEVAAPSETEEIALLAQAHDALSADPAKALGLCEKLRAQYATGRFTQEREVVEIEALVKLHRIDEATSRWNEFKRRYPTSSHRVRLEELFASIAR